jgi:hypothetical protein
MSNQDQDSRNGQLYQQFGKNIKKPDSYQNKISRVLFFSVEMPHNAVH